MYLGTYQFIDIAQLLLSVILGWLRWFVLGLIRWLVLGWLRWFGFNRIIATVSLFVCIFTSVTLRLVFRAFILGLIITFCFLFLGIIVRVFLVGLVAIIWVLRIAWFIIIFFVGLFFFRLTRLAVVRFLLRPLQTCKSTCNDNNTDINTWGWMRYYAASTKH